ncbi:hypothetical protein U1Q18_041195 [Sarracenia purpurea var. burkii]
MSTEWTDEKHSLYLKSMEASFVNDLHNTFGFLGGHSQRVRLPDPKFPGKKRANICFSSGQYKVLQGGCWEKVNFGKHNSLLDKPDGSGVLIANPWIRHFKATCGHQILTSPHQEKAALVDSNTEVCDQNFEDKDIIGEKASHTRSANIMKTSHVATSSNDQVVPSGEYPLAAYVTKSDLMSDNKGGFP